MWWSRRRHGVGSPGRRSELNRRKIRWTVHASLSGQGVPSFPLVSKVLPDPVNEHKTPHSPVTHTSPFRPFGTPQAVTKDLCPFTLSPVTVSLQFWSQVSSLFRLRSDKPLPAFRSCSLEVGYPSGPRTRPQVPRLGPHVFVSVSSRLRRFGGKPRD